MGRVIAPFGVQGWIKVHTYTEALHGLGEYPRWSLGRDHQYREMALADFAVQGNSVVARLEPCRDRQAALALQGLEIAVTRALLPAAGEGEYYWSDLVGLNVADRDGAELGYVAELLQTGANDVLRVIDSRNRERLIPFIASAIIEVDFTRQRLRVDWED